MISNSSKDIKLSINKWDEIYRRQYKDKTYYRDFEIYKTRYFKSVYEQLDLEKKISKEMVYLEIGCGPFFVGQLLARKCKLIIGIDFCPHALMIAKKMLDEKGVKNYLLIQGDILNLPLNKDSVDLIYGGGVIEHFNDTERCVGELYRVLKKRGVSFNTVPYLNIGTLTYRQLWGNIPNVPVLKQIAEFVHIKVLGGKHMIFGYEMSFLGSTLKRIHQKAGFKKTIVKKFETELSFDFAPNFLRPGLIWLAQNSRLFWPMIKVIGQK